MGLASGKSPTVHTFYQFCIMHVWTLSVLLLTSLAGGRASPLQKRYFDFDGNGLPDLCYQICELSIRCLLVDGTWTTIPSSQQLHSATDAGPLSFITAPGQTQTTSDIATASSLAEVLKSNTTKEVGAMIENNEEADLCGVWGSVVYNNYLNKYIMLCGHYSETVDMYTSSTPWGPWRGSYQIAGGGNFSGSYGMMMHPEYSPSGKSHKSWYFSLGPNWEFNMYKVTFDY